MKNRCIRATAVILSALTVFTSAAFVSRAVCYLGDVDGNSTVDAADALAVLQYSVGLIEEIDKKAADISGDGEIDSSDALLILQTSVGLKEPVTVTEENPPEEDTPLQYDKAQLIEYYNSCLTAAYSQPKFTVQKTESVDVQLDNLLFNGKPAAALQKTANSIVEKNKKNSVTETQSFTDKTATVDAQKRFILPASLYPEAVKDASASETEQGYVIKFTLNPESCDFKEKPAYNSSCTFPLDINEIDLSAFGQVKEARFEYPGTVLTASVDSEGRVVRTDVEMPLSVKNAKAVSLGQTVTVSITGSWNCTNVNVF